MIQAIQFRKTNFLGSELWMTVPWQNYSKNMEQKLYDFGFRIAATIEGLDRLPEVPDAQERAHTISRSVLQISQIDTNMDDWYNELCLENEFLFWRLPPADPHNINFDDPSTMETIGFPDLDMAHLMSVFWVLKLMCSMTANQMCFRFVAEAQSQRQQASQDSFAPPNTANSQDYPRSAPSVLAQLAQIVRNMAQRHNAAHRLTLASNIVRSVPYFLGDEMGLMPAHMILLPIRVALYELQNSKLVTDDIVEGKPQEPYPIGDEVHSSYNLEKQTMLKICLTLYNQLIEVKGLGYAVQIGRTGNRWGKPMQSEAGPQVTSGARDPTSQSDVRVVVQGRPRYQNQGADSDSESDRTTSWRAVQEQSTSERPQFTSPVLERYQARV